MTPEAKERVWVVVGVICAVGLAVGLTGHVLAASHAWEKMTHCQLVELPKRSWVNWLLGSKYCK